MDGGTKTHKGELSEFGFLCTNSKMGNSVHGVYSRALSRDISEGIRSGAGLREKLIFNAVTTEASVLHGAPLLG